MDRTPKQDLRFIKNESSDTKNIPGDDSGK